MKHQNVCVLYSGKDQHFSFSQNSTKNVSEEKLLLTFYWPFDGWLLAICQPFCFKCWPSLGWLLDNSYCCPTESGPTVNDVSVKCVPYWKVSIKRNTCTLMLFLLRHLINWIERYILLSFVNHHLQLAPAMQKNAIKSIFFLRFLNKYKQILVYSCLFYRTKTVGKLLAGILYLPTFSEL